MFKSGFVEQNDTTMTSHWNLTVWETVTFNHITNELNQSHFLSIDIERERTDN
jgi:hypothetical protein